MLDLNATYRNMDKLSKQVEIVSRDNVVFLKMLTFSAREPTLDLESDVCRRQIVMSKVDPRTERVKYNGCKMAVDP